MDGRERAMLVDSVADDIAKMEQGTIISHLTLGDMLHADRQMEQGRYYALLTAIRGALKRNYGLFLKTERGIGYVIARHDEGIDLCEGKFLAGYRTQRRAVQDGNYIRLGEIADMRKRTEAVERLQHMSNILGMEQQSLRPGIPVFIRPKSEAA